MAYINVDISVFGMGATWLTGEERNEGTGAQTESFSDPPAANTTLRAQGTPPVQSVVFSAARQVERGGVGSGAVDPWVLGCEEGPAPRLDSPRVRSPHLALAASASTTTGSDISTVVARCTAWSPGEPGAATGPRVGGRTGPAASSPNLPSRSLGSLGAGSDYAPFIHFLGISSMDIAYTYDRVREHPSVLQLGVLLHQPALFSPSGCSSED